MNRNSKLFLFAVFLFVSLQLRGEEQVFTDLNFAVTPPDDWKVITNASTPPGIFIVIYSAGEGGGLLEMKVDSSRTPTGTMNEKFIKDFDEGLEKGGDGKRVSGKFIEMDGVKGYERISNPVLQGRQVSLIRHCVLTSERFYSVAGMTLKNAPDDPNIKKTMASFRFLTPAHEPKESPQFAMYRAGYIMGKYGGGGVLIGGMLAVVISLILRNRRSKPPLLPPTA